MIKPFGSVTLSCKLPSVLTISPCNDELLTFRIFLNGDEIYATSLQCFGNSAKFYDLDQVVSQFMLDHQLSYADLEVSVLHDGGEEVVSTVVIFSNLRTNYASDANFLRDNYLTTRTFFRIPRNATQWLSYYAAPGDGSKNGVITAVLQFADNAIRSVSLSHYVSFPSEIKVYTFRISYDNLYDQIARLYPNSKFSILEATVKHDNRFMTFFFTDEQPVEVLTFINAFNVQEAAFIYGARTVVTNLSKKEAIIQRRTSFYNQSIDQRFKIETAALTIEQALWYNQLLTSRNVYCSLPDSSQEQPVLIDDVSSEIDLNIGYPIHLKFSYRFTTPEPRQSISSSNNVFDTPYAVQFGVAGSP